MTSSATPAVSSPVGDSVGRRSVATHLLHSLRPSQWTKNLFVFAGLIFAERLFDPVAAALATGAFFVFCALSGVVYLVNDIRDREADRRHPIKSRRPIASGAISPSTAAAAAVTLGAAAILSAFWINVKIFLIAEVFILVFALAIAVLRGLPGPVFFPLRALAVVYVDLFRGVPTILVIYILGFGVPALQLPGVPIEPLFWGVVSLVLVYSAYVAEVYRAGIDSVHPSQSAAARSLGLTHGQTLRFVVIPQAVRRVIPPLLNDFIGLQKDTALVGLLGVVEAFRQSQIEVAASFNFTPYIVTAILFIALTIPMARFTDWLIARDKRRQQAGRIA